MWHSRSARILWQACIWICCHCQDVVSSTVQWRSVEVLRVLNMAWTFTDQSPTFQPIYECRRVQTRWLSLYRGSGSHGVVTAAIMFCFSNFLMWLLEFEDNTRGLSVDRLFGFPCQPAGVVATPVYRQTLPLIHSNGCYWEPNRLQYNIYNSAQVTLACRKNRRKWMRLKACMYNKATVFACFYNSSRNYVFWADIDFSLSGHSNICSEEALTHKSDRTIKQVIIKY